MKPHLSRGVPGTCNSCSIPSRGLSRTGPDGHKTLCDPCGRRYGSLRLPIYKDPNGNVTASPRPGAYRILHKGFARIGKKRDMERPLVSEPPPTADRHVMGFCMRCKLTHSLGWRSGPDGARTLCMECFDLYRNCKLLLFQGNDSSISVTPCHGAKTVKMLGFQRSSPREHYMHPVVVPLEEVDGSEDTDNSIGSSSGESSSVVAEYSPALLSQPSSTVGEKKIEELPGGRLHATQMILSNGELVETCDTHARVIPPRECLANSSKTEARNLAERHLRSDASNELLRKERVAVKASFERDGEKMIRCFTVRTGLRFAIFAGMLRNVFNVDSALFIFYEDGEGDIVCLSCDVEMEEFFTEAHKPHVSMMKVILST